MSKYYGKYRWQMENRDGSHTVCESCGVLVGDITIHDDWHAKKEAEDADDG